MDGYETCKTCDRPITWEGLAYDLTKPGKISVARPCACEDTKDGEADVVLHR